MCKSGIDISHSGDDCRGGSLECSFGSSICHGRGVFNGCGCNPGNCAVSGDWTDVMIVVVVIVTVSGSQCSGGSKDVNDELFCGEYILAVDVNECY